MSETRIAIYSYSLNSVGERHFTCLLKRDGKVVARKEDVPEDALLAAMAAVGGGVFDARFEKGLWLLKTGLPVPLEVAGNKRLSLETYTKSLNPGATATKPKRVYATPEGDAYFKYGMTSNEICAELFTCAVARALNIAVAETRLAYAAGGFGILSNDIGVYIEPCDVRSYSVRDFEAIDGFIEMLLFDYLVMNEDRHAGNWGIIDGKVAALFDHNLCFGGDEVRSDIERFMKEVTTPFYVDDENLQRHDDILEYLITNHKYKVRLFANKLSRMSLVIERSWRGTFHADCENIQALLSRRVAYFFGKVWRRV
jgi:hypothetical protein